MRKVVITGVGGPAGRASVSFFHDKGCEVIGTDIVPVAAIPCSMYMVPRAEDPDFMQAMLKLVSREKPDLLIPTVSEELPQVARFKHEILAMGTSVFLSDPHVADIAHDPTASSLLTLVILLGMGYAEFTICIELGAVECSSLGKK